MTMIKNVTKESVVLTLPKFPKALKFESFLFKHSSTLQPLSADHGSLFKHTFSTSIEKRVHESLLNVIPNNRITEKNIPFASKQISEDYIHKMIHSRTSMPQIIEPQHIPEGFSKQKFLEGSVIATMIYCRQQGMSPENIALCSALSFGNPGSNMTSMEMVGHFSIFKSILNMTPYLQKDHAYSPQTLEKVQKLSMKKFMYFSESETLDWVNKSFDLKFIFYQRKAKLAQNDTIQNLTGNSSPDFVRHLAPPVGLITTEAYDQKFSTAYLSEHNHIRPVSANLGKHTNDAVSHLVDGIQEWRDKNARDARAASLLEDLSTLQKNYIENQNEQVYARSYNSLRNNYGDFLISNKIPMNLVAETGIQNYNLPQEDTKMFNTCFANMYYNPDSTWNKFVLESMKNADGTLKHADFVITTFAARYVTSPLSLV